MNFKEKKEKKHTKKIQTSSQEIPTGTKENFAIPIELRRH